MKTTTKVRDGLLSISTTNLYIQNIFSSIGIFENNDEIKYFNAAEFSRKRNARKSFINKFNIKIYFKVIYETRSQTKIT